MKDLKFFIIDPVGIKAGMDYYSLNLGVGLSQTGSGVIVSNYNKVVNNKLHIDSAFYKGSNKLFQIINWLFVHIKYVILAIFRRINFVVFHSFSYEFKDYFAIALFKLFRIPIAIILHDVSNFSKKDSIFFKRKILGFAKYLIVHNNFSLNEVKNLNIGGLTDKLHVLKHGSFIDLPNSLITKDIARKLLGYKDEEKIVLFFGQIKKVKGLDILINAFNQCQTDCHLVIAGKTWKDNSAYYQELIEGSSKSSKISFYNEYITNDKRELFYKAADVIVLPYREIYQSGVLLMAMSYSLPVIASDLPANLEIIKDKENGLLFKSEDIEDLSRTIDYFFEKTYKTVTIETKAHELMSTVYNWSTIGKSYIQLLNT